MQLKIALNSLALSSGGLTTRTRYRSEKSEVETLNGPQIGDWTLFVALQDRDSCLYSVVEISFVSTIASLSVYEE